MCAPIFSFRLVLTSMTFIVSFRSGIRGSLVSLSQTLYQMLNVGKGLGTLHTMTCAIHQHSGRYSVIVVGVSSCFAKALHLLQLPNIFGYTKINNHLFMVFIAHQHYSFDWTCSPNSICTSRSMQCHQTLSLAKRLVKGLAVRD